MGNTMVNGIGSDTAMLLTGLANNSQTKNSSLSDKDFNSILGQAREKTLQTSATNTDNKKADNPTREKMTDVSDKNKAAETKTTDTVDTDAQKVQQNDAKPDKKQIAGEKEVSGKTDMEEPEALDEETMEAIAEVVNQIFTQTAEILEFSEEELQAMMEELDISPVDLLNPDSMVQLALAAGGEDSVISIVMNENIYDNLHDLVQVVEEQLDVLTEQTGLTQNELTTVLEQLSSMEEEAPLEQMPQLDEGLEMPENEMVTEKMEPLFEKEQPETEVTQLTRTNDTITEENVLQKTVIQSPENDTYSSKENAGEKESTGQQSQMTPFQQHLETIQQDGSTAEVAADMTTDYAPTPENILKQLADYVKVQSGKELTEMEMQLHPASLGTVHISISNRGGTISAQITTQNETVKDAIESQIVNLKSNLEEQGVKVDVVEVSVASHQMEKNLEQGGKDRKNQEESNKKTDSIRRIRRTSINLNAWQEEDDEAVDADEAEAVELAKEMMQLYGNSMDLLA